MFQKVQEKTSLISENKSNPSHHSLNSVASSQRLRFSSGSKVSHHGNKFLSSQKNQSLQNCQQPRIQLGQNGRNITEEIPLNEFLLSLSYSEKLYQIEKIIDDCRKLVSIYGYFYMTKSMIHFENDGVECWIHPLKKSKKPLHPIHRKTKTEAQKQFYTQLRLVLKELYSTIPFPKNNNEKSFLSHFQKLRKNLNYKILKNKSIAKISQTTQTLIRVKTSKQTLKQKQKTLKQLLSMQPKKIKRSRYLMKKQSKCIEHIIENQQEDSEQCDEDRKTPYQKNTMSTLVGSMKSDDSIKVKKNYNIDYEGKKSVIIEKRDDESMLDYEQDFNQLFSNSELSHLQIQEEAIEELQKILAN